ncbi:MAG: exodeoxyribonuclease III [Zetaproteobacteria bacterium]|nr:MAG: exodeoxyribonuclease III [Zetaproteobacteria bacterium]
MKLISLNANGIRSAADKGFFDWAQQQAPDVICLQEVRATPEQWPRHAHLPGYWRYCAVAARAGYAGVAVLTRYEPREAHIGLAALSDDPLWRRFDEEGRFVLLAWDEVAVGSIYVPSGTTNWARQAGKMRFLDRLLGLLEGLVRRWPRLVLAGDWNIAHEPIDIKNDRSNRKNSGFLPEERAWFDRLLALGFVDAFRRLHPEEERFSWWSNRGRAREKNVGWRIDYVIASEPAAEALEEAWILGPEPRFSDHAPIGASFRLAL